MKQYYYPSSNPTKTIEKCNPENEIYPEPEFISPQKYAKQTILNLHALITKSRYDLFNEEW